MLSNFERWAVYQTSYGRAQAVRVLQDGLFARFVILWPSTEAAKGGYQQGSTFTAHLKDQTEPSPSSWTKLQQDRRQ